MPDSLELPALYVEGTSDYHTIRHLLRRHGIELDQDLGPVVLKKPEKVQNDKGVLDMMLTAARASTNRSVGFVIDADVPVRFRWQAVCDRLRGFDLTLPNRAPIDGFIGDSPKYKARIGVWIMPDNTTDTGTLGDFVNTLVPIGDKLFEHAHSATVYALTLGAAFPPQDRKKAELHCWLAWQKEPGLPFGSALKAQFLRHDSAVANRFVAWFKSLYSLA